MVNEKPTRDYIKGYNEVAIRFNELLLEYREKLEAQMRGSVDYWKGVEDALQNLPGDFIECLRRRDNGETNVYRFECELFLSDECHSEVISVECDNFTDARLIAELEYEEELRQHCKLFVLTK